MGINSKAKTGSSGRFDGVGSFAWAHEHSPHARPPAELHVLKSIAYHDGPRKIDLWKVILRLQCHANTRLAQRRVVTFQVGREIDAINPAATCGIDLCHHPGMNAIEIVGGV